jgi:hypothetical protein
MTSPQPDSLHPDADRAAGRRRLADLIGLLLARQWMRERGVQPRNNLLPGPQPRPAPDRMGLPPDGG